MCCGVLSALISTALTEHYIHLVQMNTSQMQYSAILILNSCISNIRDSTVADPGEGCTGCTPPPENRFLLYCF